MNCKELKAQCKELKIRGYSKMTKAELENVIYLKQISNWYDDLLFEPGQISNWYNDFLLQPEMDIEEEIISLNTNEISEGSQIRSIE